MKTARSRNAGRLIDLRSRISLVVVFTQLGRATLQVEVVESQAAFLGDDKVVYCPLDSRRRSEECDGKADDSRRTHLVTHPGPGFALEATCLIVLRRYRPEVRAVLIYSVDARFAVTLRIEEGARADGVTRASMLFAGGEDFAPLGHKKNPGRPIARPGADSRQVERPRSTGNDLTPGRLSKCFGPGHPNRSAR